MSPKAVTTEYTTQQLSEILNAELCGSGDLVIEGLNTIAAAGPKEMCYASSEKNVSKMPKSKAAAVLVSEKIQNIPHTQLIVKNVDAAVIEMFNLYAPKLKSFSGIHPTAVIEDDAVIGENVAVGPHTYIAGGVEIAQDTIIGANCAIGENTVIGQSTKIDCGVVIYHNCFIGSHCVIQSNTTIGAVGFGYSFIDGEHKLIPHNGGVIIEDYVHIGAGSCVDRSKFGNTVIGAGTKIDNLVQIGHGVTTGKCCLMAGHVGIAGSTKLGDGVVMGGQSGIGDNLEIGSGAMVAGHSGVMQNLDPGSQVAGAPAIDVKARFKEVVILSKMPEILKEFKKIAAKVEKLEASEDN